MTPKDAVSILPRKTIEGELTSVADDGSFVMYALVFGNVDRQGDRIAQGSVTNVDELVSDGWIALNHVQVNKPIAYIDTAEQDSRGLKIAGRFHSHQEAQDVRSYVKERLAAGKKVKTSIGYLVPVDGEQYVKENGRTIRDISKLAVYEASFVNLPANPAAEVISAKSLDGTEPVESEEEMSAAKVLREVKRALGLAVKGQYKVDGEEVEKARGLVDKCLSCSKAIATHHKAMKEAVDDHAQASGELMKCFKNFTSGQQQDKDPKNEGNVADEDKEDDDEEEKDDEDDDKTSGNAKVKDDEEESDDDKARKSLRSDLRRRLLSSRFSSISE
jgi:HK97 family phage prohead protease